MVGARDYHEQTKHSPASVRSIPHLNWDNKPIPYKIYTDLPSVPLADAIRPSQIPTLRAITDSNGNGSRARPDLEALTQICWLSNGITKTITRGDRTIAFRAAACTGALYHNDLHLVTSDLGNLTAGVYHFDPRTLALNVLREGDFRGVLAAAAGNRQSVASAPVTVIVTSTWWRNAWKYQARTYRHAFWDSGTILANMLAVTNSLGLPTEVVTGFADNRIAELLGVNPDQEAPLEIVPVGRDDPVPNSIEVSPISPETRPLSPDPKTYPLITDAYRSSSLPDGEATNQWRDHKVDRSADRRHTNRGELRSLSPVVDTKASKTPPYHVIRRRGSCRSFTRATLNWRKLSTILDRAMRGIPFDVSPSNRLAFTKPYLIVSDVDDVPAGAYRYHPSMASDDGGLELLRAGEFQREAGHIALDQQLAADASVCIYFLADLERLVDVFGDRGYRLAQLEASITAGRLYLAAYAHRDLGATGLTFYDDLVTEFFRPDAGDETPMFLWALGRPA